MTALPAKDEACKGIYYLDIPMYPVYCFFAKHEAAMRAEEERLGIEPGALANNFPRPGCGHTWALERNGRILIAIALGPENGYSLAHMAGVAAHEADHAAQFLWEHIGEDKPGSEADAYLVEYITEFCLKHIAGFRKIIGVK